MTTTAPRPATRSADLRPLYLAAVSLAAAASVVFPLLGDLQDAHGLPTWGLGTIAGTAFLTGVATQLLLAPIADRGHARRLLLGGVALAAASSLLFALGSSLPVFVLARALAGAGLGAFVPAARAICATADPARAGERLGRLAGAELAGYVIGPSVGGLLAGPLGLRWPFVLFAVLAALTLVPLARGPVPPLAAGGTSSRPSLGLLRVRDVRVAVLVAVALFLPVGIYDALWDRYLEDRGASNVLIGLSFALYGVPFAALATAGGRLVDRTRAPIRLGVASLVLIGPMTALYGILSVPVVIVAVAVLEGVVQALAVPATQAALAKACPPGRAAAGQGLAGASQQATAAVVAFAAAPAYGALGPEAVFVAAAALILALAAAAGLTARRSGEPVRTGAR